VIRPLFDCREHDIARYAEQRAFPIIPCNLCGSQDKAERKAIGRMLSDWDRAFPGRVENIARSLRRASPSHLADPALFDFAGLAVDPQAPKLIPLRNSL
jgi:tRNA 2-thiocytidine biosynthesis protein TtcA